MSNSMCCYLVHWLQLHRIYASNCLQNSFITANWEKIPADELRDIKKRSKSTSCSLDPIPTWQLLTQWRGGSGWARVKPLLKSPKLDPNELKNYRPVSNLSYISKLLERVVARRLNNHMITNGLHEPLQSAYKAGHSTTMSSQIWIISQLL